MKHHDHICWICDDQHDWQSVVIPFCTFGLSRNERYIYLGNRFPRPLVSESFSLGNLDLDMLEGAGQLRLFDSPGAIWSNGSRRPDRLVDFLLRETKIALDDGFSGVRFTCEVAWAFGVKPEPGLLAEYESLLADRLLAQNPCIGLCMYDSASLGEPDLQGAIMSHSILIKDSKAFHNVAPMALAAESGRRSKALPSDRADAGGAVGGGAKSGGGAGGRSGAKPEDDPRVGLADSMLFLKSILDDSRQAFCAQYPDGRIMACNKAFCELTGYPPEETESLSWAGDLVPAEWRESERSIQEEMARTGKPRIYSMPLLRKDGCQAWVEVYRHQVLGEDGEVLYYCAFVNDVTNRKMEEEQLLFKSFEDPLTGLPNRFLFMDRLRQAIESARRSEEYRFSVICLDLDGFKEMNESYGHLAGDRLLAEVGRRIRGCLRGVDSLARLGADDFAVLLVGPRSEDEAVLVASRIQQALRLPVTVGASAVEMTASIGIVTRAEGYERPEQILHDADSAVYRSKTLGKGRSTCYARRPRSSNEILLVNDLRRALERQEFILLYQPIVSLKTGLVSGFEALLRWVHPLRGMVEPREFMNAAIETGESVPISAWVLREACRQARSWNSRFPGTSMTVSVNLAGSKVAGDNLVRQVEEAIETTGLDPRCLKLEFQKRSFMSDGDSMASILMQLKELDIQLAIDDFVVGCPALSRLQSYSIVPIDAVKIDRAVVSRITTDERQAESVWSIAMIAQSLGIDVIAKGIETREQVDKLLSLKCEFGQGYYFSRPVLCHKAEAIIHDQHVLIA